MMFVNASRGVCGAEPRLDAEEDEGVRLGVSDGGSFPYVELDFRFFCFLDTHGVPWSSWT